MKKNRYDRVTDRMLARIERVSDKMTQEFKNTNPYDKEPISEDQQLSEYMAMTPETMDERLQRDGIEATNAWIEEMEDIKAKQQYAQWRKRYG